MPDNQSPPTLESAARWLLSRGTPLHRQPDYVVVQKWDLEGLRLALSRTSEAAPQDVIERVARAIRDVKGGLNYDYMDFCRDAARAAIEAIPSYQATEASINRTLREALDQMGGHADAPAPTEYDRGWIAAVECMRAPREHKMRNDERTALLTLAERVEQATGPDRELFVEAYQLANSGRLWFDGDTDSHLRWQRFEALLRVGAWLDAALTLVPEGVHWNVGSFGLTEDRPFARVGRGTGTYAATPALALTAAALRARAPDRTVGAQQP